MSNAKHFAGAILFAAAATVPVAASAGTDPRGVWLNDTGRGAIEIKRCGSRLCGHVVWVKDTNDKKGCGRQIIGNLAKVNQRMWDRGWIYSPERKKRFDVEIVPLKNGNLRVKGYAGSKFFSKTMIWTPAPANLKRCGEKQVIAKKETKPAVKKVAETKPVAKKPAAKPQVSEKKKPEPKVVKSAAVVEPKAEKVETAKVEPNSTADVFEKAAVTPSEQEPKKTVTARAETDTAVVSDAQEVASESPAPSVSETTEEAAVAEETQTAEADTGDDIDVVSEGGNGGSGLNFGKFLKRTDSGRCKLDLPWVKLNFKCNDLEKLIDR